ncbi:hypothetical protein GCM10017083_26190 [Thalassobaculum fulvum]|jgi:hypothetical protein|uniref:Motility protein n=1 Tax=Thalassobaculum fulvum TaxID=1633335 RepID=A0A918XTA4_9PROT|nr:hypothetical protein [Thalassobaculum fulvum]GHD51577.1 hypothetical protein GCM10017083_26190 [Thalassobaculum fulvum]
MAIDGIGTTLSSHTVAGVRAQNEQVRTLGAGFSKLLEGAAQVAEGAQGAASSSAAAPIDPNRGQTVDIFA